MTPHCAESLAGQVDIGRSGKFLKKELENFPLLPISTNTITEFPTPATA
jgi:hypothetical protein